MANTFIKISTITVGSGGTASIDFTSIPATYTDLLVVASTQTSRTGGVYADNLAIQFNGSSANLSLRGIEGSGSAAVSFTDTAIYGRTTSSLATSIFGSTSFYIPNYTSANYKSVSVDSVAELNAATQYMTLISGLWSNTAAITSIKLLATTGPNLQQYSSATLYGIKSS